MLMLCGWTRRRKSSFAKSTKQGKPIAVICHGSWLLVSAGLKKGRTPTRYATIQDDIRNSGGQWLDREVVRDRNWISSRQPSDLPAFNREMIALFSAQKASAHNSRAEERRVGKECRSRWS